MTTRKYWAFGCLLLIAAPTMADTFDLTWNTVDSGGASASAGGGFTLSGTIGKPDAGTLTGGALALKGGFWSGVRPPCPEDLNADGVVDLPDLAILLSHYGQSGVPPADGDLNGDGIIDLQDLAELLANYGFVCP